MKRPKIKITLIDQKGTMGCHRGHKVGDTFDFDTERGKICPMAMHVAFPYIDILRYGGEIPNQEKGTAVFACPDVDTLNVFKIERVEEQFFFAMRGMLEMINKLHLAMIELYSGDARRIQHFCKVHSYAKIIAETENVDEKCLLTLEAAALTHDIGIHLCEEKYGNCNGKLQEKEGPALAEKLLDELGFDCDVSERVQYLIAHHHTYDNIDGIDYQILVEADFLVNIMEDGLSKKAALNAYHSIFKTECGKKICKEMFGIC